MLPGKFFPILRKQVGWYLFWTSPWVIILALSTVLNGYAAPLPQPGIVLSPARPESEAVKAKPMLQTTPTPEVAGTPGSGQGVAPASIDSPLFLPLIFKAPSTIICLFGIEASDCVFGTQTPTSTPFGTPPGFGTPTDTPAPTPTKPSTATATPTVFFRFLSNGDFEDGPDHGWEEFSSGGFDVIIEEDPPHLPELPVNAFGDWSAWLGGADNEHTYIRQRVTVPRDGFFLSFNFYIQSYDICGSTLTPPRVFDQGGLKINNIDISRDFPGCTFELCEPKDIAGQWFTMVVSTLPFGGPGSTITVEFWAKTDATNTSSLFIDNVAFVNDPDTVITLTSLDTVWIVKSPTNPSPPLKVNSAGFYKTK